jgi:uncharacterized membrane protein YphA (DoxX/SURF4 family)
MSIGLLILRVVLGGLLIGHGTQKLLGWSAGPAPRAPSRCSPGSDIRSRSRPAPRPA